MASPVYHGRLVFAVFGEGRATSSADQRLLLSTSPAPRLDVERLRNRRPRRRSLATRALLFSVPARNDCTHRLVHSTEAC